MNNRQRSKFMLAGGVLLVAGLALSACSTGSSPTKGADDPLTTIKAASLIPAAIVGIGPYGEKSAAPDSVTLSEADITTIKAAGIKVGIVMQTMDIEWSTEQVRGITDQVTKLGGKVIGVCDGAWSVDKQGACVDNMITQKPNAIISIPVDDVAMAPSYAKISEAGIKLIFIDNVAKGLKFPSQYQGMVTSDNQGNGALAAEALAKYIPKKGVVGVLDFGVDFFVTKERMRGFVAWMKENRSDITVKIAEFKDPSKSGDDAANFLTANPDVQGMFTEWEVPAMGIITALRAQGKTLPITVVNVASDIALDLASGGMVKAIGAQRPYDEGVAEANMAARAIVGMTNPSYLAFPAAPFLRNNVLSAWKDVYKSDAPKEIQAACANGICS